ncbi:MAG: GNAT family N-acetyltransferase [Bacteroidales bacterium]|nr:GNAT family N-acetyltransferase [Bacteroidales bacterium]
MIESSRILLRPWQESDAEALYKYASDPIVGNRAGWPPHQSAGESLEIIRTVFNNPTTWAIVLKETGEAIGAMGYMPDCPLNLPAREGEPLVGYWVGKPHWNKGICTEALKLMLKYIRKETTYSSLISSHFIDNPASGRVMEKCGFLPTGETAIDESLYSGGKRTMRVLRLELQQNTMNIRLEQPEDYREVEDLTREAFWNVYAPGCVEHYVLNQYRHNPDFIKELDFVLEEDGKIIGHVMFSKAEIIKEDGTIMPAWTFGPISIHPDYKRKGYGLKLLQYALEKAKAMGIGFICMEGNIDFYKHAGFVVASTLGIHYHAEPKDAEVPYFLAQELIPGYLNGVEGTYHTPKGYYVAFENKEAFEAYEATFPKKEKKQQDGQLVDDCTKNPNE